MSDFRVLLAKFYSIGLALTSFDGQCLLMITKVDYDVCGMMMVMVMKMKVDFNL